MVQLVTPVLTWVAGLVTRDGHAHQPAIVALRGRSIVSDGPTSLEKASAAHTATTLPSLLQEPTSGWERQEAGPLLPQAPTSGSGHSGTQERVHYSTRPPLFDVYFFIYWGVVFLCFVVAAMLIAHFKRVDILQQSHATMNVTHSWKCLHHHPPLQDLTIELPRNVWSMNLVAALDRAYFGKHWTIPIPVYAVAFVSICMGSIQIFAVYLVVHDINPDAHPVTKVASSPWVDDPWTVNAMKWVQVFFLTVAAVPEVNQARTLFLAAMMVEKTKISVSRSFLICLAVFQYLVDIGVIWCGVCAVLSFQAVPDMIYSSMAILFVLNVDETLFEFFEHVLLIEADFVLTSQAARDRGEEAEDSDGELAGRPEVDDPRGVPESGDKLGDFRAQDLSIAQEMAVKAVVLFPVLLGFFLISRAWQSDVMPNSRSPLFHSP